MATKHIIWSSDINIKDWEKDIKEYMPDATEQQIYEEAVRTNNSYLEDLTYEFNKTLNEDIVVIADLGLWDGRRKAYKLIGRNLDNCFITDCEMVEWYIDGYNDLRCRAGHHDGTNHYLYRVFKENISDTTKSNFLEKIYNGTVTRQDITRCTTGLGKIFSDHYGW